MADYETIVVGMGAAGTMAVSTLAQAGVKVLALEAMDRIGGRVHTVPFGDGAIELGAEWIHGTYQSRPYELATKHGVELVDQIVYFETLLSDGSKANSNLINKPMMQAMEALDEESTVDETFGQFFTRKIMAILKEDHPEVLEDKDFITEYLAFVDLVMRNYTSADTWDDVAAKTEYEQLEGHQHVSWGVKGYRTLFDILLNEYNNGPGLPSLTIKLKSEVTKISYSHDPSKKVTVTTKDGAKYTADNVIVTVSLGVLKARHKELFNPKLLEPKATAIDKISIGVMDKVIFLFERPWWPKIEPAFFGFLWKGEDRKSLAAEDDWLTKVFAASTPKGCGHALTLWTSGEVGKMVETMPEDVVKRKLMSLLKRFMGKGINLPEPIAMTRSTWFHNPFTLGSYSYDSMITRQYPTARTDLEAPITDSAGNPRVLFAGEATDFHHYSTVHGAIDTGYREATRLLKRRVKNKL